MIRADRLPNGSQRNGSKRNSGRDRYANFVVVASVSTSIKGIEAIMHMKFRCVAKEEGGFKIVQIYMFRLATCSHLKHVHVNEERED